MVPGIGKILRIINDLHRGAAVDGELDAVLRGNGVLQNLLRAVGVDKHRHRAGLHVGNGNFHLGLAGVSGQFHLHHGSGAAVLGGLHHHGSLDGLAVLLRVLNGLAAEGGLRFGLTVLVGFHRAGGAVSGLVLGDGTAVLHGLGLDGGAVRLNGGFHLRSVRFGDRLHLRTVRLGGGLRLGGRCVTATTGGRTAGTAGRTTATTGRTTGITARRAAGLRGLGFRLRLGNNGSILSRDLDRDGAGGVPVGRAGDDHFPACGLARICRGQAVRQLERGAGEVLGRNDVIGIHHITNAVLDDRILNLIGRNEIISGDFLSFSDVIVHLTIVVGHLKRVRLGHGNLLGLQHARALLGGNRNMDALANILGRGRVRFLDGTKDPFIVVIPLVGQLGTSGREIGDGRCQGLVVLGRADDGDGALQLGLFGRDGLCGLTVVKAKGKPLPLHPNKGVSAHRPGGPLADKLIAAPLGQE